MKQNFVQGVTFLEVMIALFVLAVGIIPAFQVFSRGNAGTMMNRDEILAHQYAGELIDFATAQGFNQLSPDDYKKTSMPVVEGGSSLDETNFHRYLTVKLKIPSKGIADWPMAYKVIIAEVEWKSGGISQYFALTSLVYQGRKE